MLDLISGTDLIHLLAVYGYWSVFAIVAVESMGVPVPGDMLALKRGEKRAQRAADKALRSPMVLAA